jgi:hypothetical protein
LPEGSWIALWRVRDDVEVEFEAMVGSWGIGDFQLESRKNEERDGQKATFERLGKCATGSSFLFLNSMTDK